MLVFLEMTPSQIESMPPTEREAFFDKFVDASRNGNHRFNIPMELSEWMPTCEILSEEVRSHMAFLGESSMYQSDFQGELDHVYLEIQFGKSKPTLENQNKWVIGHKEIVKGNYLEPCHLVVENSQRDGKFYDLVFNNQKKRNRNNFKNLKYTYFGGENFGIGHIFLKNINKNKIVCCICDSDKLAPMHEYGPTFKGIENKIRNKNFIGIFDATPCHEIENFLSIDIIGDLMFEIGEKQKGAALSKIKNHIQAQTPIPDQGQCLWLYFDVKDGLNGKKIMKQNVSKNVQKWLCKKYGVTEVSKINIPNLGRFIIEKFLEENKHHKIQSDFHKHMRSNYWDSHYFDWTNKFMWYFVGQDEHIT